MLGMWLRVPGKRPWTEYIHERAGALKDLIRLQKQQKGWQ